MAFGILKAIYMGEINKIIAKIHDSLKRGSQVKLSFEMHYFQKIKSS